MRRLSSEEISFYKEQGYLSLEDVLPPADLQPLIKELNEVIDRKAREAYAEGRLRELFEDEPFERRLARICDAVDDPKEIWGAVHTSPGNLNTRTAGMFGVVTHPAILDIVESVIGPAILAHPQFSVRAKLPNQADTVVPWHQDMSSLQREVDRTFMANFWIPLVDATVENGCMEVIARSHQYGLIEHVRVNNYLGGSVSYLLIPEEATPSGERVQCQVRVGGVLLTQKETVHRSGPNRTDHIRWSLDLRYSNPALPTGRPHVPGFIAGSRAHPESVAKSHLDWLRLMESSQMT